MTGIATFALAFTAMAAAIHLALPDPLSLHADMRSEKLVLLDDWRGRASTASFGSSHMHNGFDPRAFDTTIASEAKTTSINLAVAGGSQVEQRALAMRFVQALQAKPGQACFVVMEVNAGANFTNDHLVHPRAINSYDWQALRFIKSASPLNLGIKRAAGRMGYALVASLMYYTNTGMLSNLLFHAPLDEVMLHEETRDDRRGLYEPPIPQRVLDDIQRMFRTSSRKSTPTTEPLTPATAGLVNELVAASPVKGLKTIYVALPRIDNLEKYPVFPESVKTANGETPIFNLGRPDLYPEIYQPQNWSDDSHLNEAGAAIASHHLGELAASWYRTHPQPMECR